MPVLEIENLVKHFSAGGGLFAGKKKPVRAVDGVSLTLDRGETLGIVGESGSGKSTLGLLSLGLIRKTSGKILFLGSSVDELQGAGLTLFRRKAQIVFQNPFASLNPRMIIRDI
ncbi:MAG: ATP-binding cassette domain-containing protein, partial [Synergistaceae bacterium]|nr:ATP-binding cassette domain-containing protein [Synergistaceae bacterium]